MVGARFSSSVPLLAVPDFNCQQKSAEHHVCNVGYSVERAFVRFKDDDTSPLSLLSRTVHTLPLSPGPSRLQSPRLPVRAPFGVSPSKTQRGYSVSSAVSRQSKKVASTPPGLHEEVSNNS